MYIHIQIFGQLFLKIFLSGPHRLLAKILDCDLVTSSISSRAKMFTWEYSREMCEVPYPGSYRFNSKALSIGMVFFLKTREGCYVIKHKENIQTKA